MNCCEVTYLVLHILLGVVVTTLYILAEAIHLIIPRKLKSVKGEIVLVTGAGRGLGRRLALNFGRRQAFVVCWDKNAEINQNTVWDVRQEGGQAIGYKCDVTDRKSVMETAILVQQQVGHVTILVNNAGIYPIKPLVDWTPEELHRLFDTNIMSHFWTLEAFLPAMLERNSGHVVAISAAAAIAPVAHEVPYSASKAAVSALMDGLIQELRLQPNSKIKVTCVHPYYAACRNDLPVKFDLRIGRLSPDYVAKEIIRGVLQEREVISVPRFMLFWIYFLRCLPQKARKLWREIFYTRVWPEPVVQVNNESKIESSSVPPGSTPPTLERTTRSCRSNKTLPTKVELNNETPMLTEICSPGDDSTNPVRIINMLNRDSAGKTSPSLPIRNDIFTKIEGGYPDTETSKDNEQEMSKL